MTQFEYKVVPAHKRGEKVKGVKAGEARFAHTLETLMNDMGAQGWEYQRADTLPSEERSGLTSRTTVFQNVLVFRRALQSDDAVIVPAAAPVVDPEAVKMTRPADAPGNAPPVGPAVNTDTARPKTGAGATVAAE